MVDEMLMAELEEERRNDNDDDGILFDEIE